MIIILKSSKTFKFIAILNLLLKLLIILNIEGSLLPVTFLKDQTQMMLHRMSLAHYTCIEKEMRAYLTLYIGHCRVFTGLSFINQIKSNTLY